MKKSIKETVREAIEPTVNELGYEIWDVTYSKIGADYHLEIFFKKRFQSGNLLYKILIILHLLQPVKQLP